MKHSRLVLLGAALLFVGSQVAAAQELTHDKGSILKGRIEDASGAPLPGAFIQLYTWSGEYVGASEAGSDGSFHLSGIGNGVYTLKADVNGQHYSTSITKTTSDSITEIRLGDDGQKKLSLQPRVSVNDLQVPDIAKKKFGKAAKALQQHNQNLALRWINEAITAAPRWGRAYLFRGVLFMQSSLYPQAEHDFTEAVTADPSNGTALAALGSVYLREKQYPKADFYLERAVATSPAPWQAYFELAKLRFVQHKYEDAIRQGTEAITIEPDAPPECHLLLAESYIGAQKYAEAGIELTAYLSTKPQGTVADRARQQLAEIRRVSAERYKAATQPATPPKPAVTGNN